MALTPTTMPHPLAPPPAPAARPVVTHPHTIRVTPGPAATDTSSSGPRLRAPRTRVPPAPAAAKGGKGKGRATTTAGSSFDAQVNAALKAELDPQTAAINSGYQQILTELRNQQAKATADAAAQAQTIQGYYGALTPLLQGIGPAVQGGYQDAANSVAGYAKGFSGSLGDTAAADAAQTAQLLGENAAPDAQTAAAAQAAGTGGGAANALYGIGGYIPSAELSAQGAAAGAAARQLPATYSGVGAQNAAQALGVGAANVRDIGTTIGEQAQKHAADLATLAAGVPKLRNDITSQFQNMSMKQQQLAFEHILATGTNPLTGQLTPAARAQIAALTGTDPATGKPTLAARNALASQAEANARLRVQLNKVIAAAAKDAAADRKPNASLSRAAGMLLDSNGKFIPGPNGKPQILPGFKAGPNNTAVKITKPAAGAGKVGANPDFPNLTKAQVTHLRAGIAAAFNGVPEQRDVNGKLVAAALPKVDYQTAIDHAVSAGYSRAGATKMANRFYMPGQRGRPAKPSPDTGFRSANLGGPPAPGTVPPAPAAPAPGTPKGLTPMPNMPGVYLDNKTLERDKNGRRLYGLRDGYAYSPNGPIVFPFPKER